PDRQRRCAPGRASPCNAAVCHSRRDMSACLDTVQGRRTGAMSAKCGAVFKVVPAILSCAALAFPAGAAAPDRDGAIAAERSWVAALNAADVPALEKILGDDFQDVSWRGGLRRKADMLAALRSGQVHVNEISEVEAVTYDKI